MLLKIYPENPAIRHIKALVTALQEGEVVIFPTDTIYAIGCDILHPKSIDRIERIKGTKKGKESFSILVRDLSMLSDYTLPFSNSIFRMIRRNTPGPFTFILNANRQVPKLFQTSKKTVGIRIPNNYILNRLIDELGHPLVSTSIHDEDKIVEYTTDPELIHEKFSHLVDYIVDGGTGDNEASTIVNCTSGQPVITRQGKGILEQ